MDASSHKKPPKNIMKKALDEIIPELIHDHGYNNTAADFLVNKISSAITIKFKGGVFLIMIC
jgi:hypothetical protein